MAPHPTASTRRVRHWAAWTLIGLAGLAGFWFGYDFGYRLSGRGLGVVTGLNAALFCSLIADAATGWWTRWRSRPPGGNPTQR
jgi:hypothetical protein